MFISTVVPLSEKIVTFTKFILKNKFSGMC